MLKKFLTIFLFIISPAFAIEEINKGDVLNLEQCIEIALRNSPEIAQAKNRVKMAKSGVLQAKSNRLPAIGVGVGYSGSRSRTHHRTNKENRFGADGSISQLIYDFGKTNADISAQKFNLVASEYELDYTILETEHAVKEAYYGVLAAKANVDIQIQNVEINERNFEQIKAFFNEGIKSRVDYVNADVNLSEAKISLLEAQDKYHDSMISLNKSLYITDTPDYSISQLEKFNIYNDTMPVAIIHGHDREHDHDVTHGHEKLHEDEMKEISLTGIIRENEIVKDHKPEKFDKTFDEILEIANKNRPDFKAYLAMKDAAKASLKGARRSWLPELSANAGYNYSYSDDTSGNSFSYGADFSFPMLRPTEIKARIDIANTEYDNANEDIKLIYQTIYYQLQQALCETKINENEIPLALDKIRLAKENFELAEGRYLEGIGNYIELQDSRSKYLNAQQEYINTVYKYALARAGLDFAMGVK